MRQRALFATLLFSLTFACVCTPGGKDKDEGGAGGGGATPTGASPAAGFSLDLAKARIDIAEIAKEPHPLGSERQAAITAWLEQRIAAAGAKAMREPFTADVPNPAAESATGPVAQTLEKSGVNMWALDVATVNAPCVVALASHYDTKEIDGLRYVGANDSGSSSVTLLHQVEWLRTVGPTLGLMCDIVAVWFDGEEARLFNWTDGQVKHPAQKQDNTYGSRHAAGRLGACEYGGAATKCLPADLGGKPLVALVLMDMIGSPELQLSRDSYSSDSLIALAAEGALAVATKGVYDERETGVQDDHIPFRNAGIPVLDLIDFNNLDYWHRAGDEAANVSVESMQTAGRIALHVALRVAKDPSLAKP